MKIKLLSNSFQIYIVSMGLVSIFYLPGLIFFPLIKDVMPIRYGVVISPYCPFIIVFSVYSLAYTVAYFIFVKIRFKIHSIISYKCINLISWALVFFYFFLSLYFFFKFDISFRHQTSLSEAGTLVQALLVLKAYVSVVLLLMILVNLTFKHLYFKHRLKLFIIGISSMLAVTSSLQFLFAIANILLAAYPRLFSNPNTVKFYLILLVLLTASVLTAVYVGLANKVGFSQAFSFLYNDFFIQLKLILSRISSSLVSLGVNFNGDFNGRLENLFTTIYSTFLDRSPLHECLYNCLEPINRQNFLLIASEYHSRAGASPGPLASGYFVLGNIIGVIIIAFLIAFITSLVGKYKFKPVTYNCLSMMGIMLCLLPLFEAPLNMFYILDPIFFYFLFILGSKLLAFDKLLVNFYLNINYVRR